MLRAHPEQKQPLSDKPLKVLADNKSPAPQAPIEQIDEATEIILSAKQEYLENKLYTTLEDDFELQLLKDPSTRLHASRITELSFKEDRTPAEKDELDLYEKLESRPHAFRIMDLKNKGSLTKLEEIELKFLTNPILRPYTQDFLSLANKNKKDMTPKENRILDLLLDVTTFKNAHEIADLEELDILSSEQVRRLSIDYLTKLANVSCDSRNDFHKDFRSHSFNPAMDCVFIDARLQTYNPELARFRSIEDAFNNAAKRLMDSYMRQTFRSVNRSSALVAQSFFEQKPSENPLVLAICKTREQALALTLEKIFFEHNIPFSQKNLDTITDYLNDLIVNQKLILNASQYKELERMLNDHLMNSKASEPIKRYG